MSVSVYECCINAIRQLNDFVRISRYLNAIFRLSIHHMIIIGRVCGKKTNAKLGKSKNDRFASYEDLLRNTRLFSSRLIDYHDDVIKWKHFPRYWPFVRIIHRSPVNSPHKGQWRGALMFSLICVWINGWVNNRGAGDLRRHRAHNDVMVMIACFRNLYVHPTYAFTTYSK